MGDIYKEQNNNHKFWGNLTPEQELVLLLTHFRNPDRERISGLVSNKPNWVEVLGYIMFNRVGGIAQDTILKCKLPIGTINREVRFELYMIHEMQKIRTKTHSMLTMEIAKHMDNLRIPHAFLKGTILSHFTYPQGCRVSNDIDLLINSKDLTLLSQALQKAGFIQGFYDRTSEEIRPASRKEIIRYRMNYGEAVPFLKKVDMPGFNLVEVDVNFSLDWMAQGTESAVEAFLKQTDKYYIGEGDTVKSLSKEYFLAHLCMHLYKEIYLLEWVQGLRDLVLYKFADIYAFLTMPDMVFDWNKFVSILEDNKICKECYCAIEFTRLFFPVLRDISSLTEVMEKIKPDDRTYMDEVIDARNPDIKYMWDKDLISRFFDMKRYESLKRVSNHNGNLEG